MDNYEASFLLQGSKKSLNTQVSALENLIQSLIDDKEIVVADGRVIEEYSVKHGIWKAEHAIARKRFKRIYSDVRKRAKNSKIVITDTLGAILAEMKADKSENGFDAQRRSRQKTHQDAKTVLTELTRSTTLSRKKFLEIYGELCSGMWHSGGLHRGKNRIAGSAEEFREGIRIALANKPERIELIFDKLRSSFASVIGAGVNVITEILHTIDNKKFAVIN